MRPPLSYVPAFPAALGLVTGIVIHSIGIFYTAIFASIFVFAILYFTHRQYYSFFALFIVCGILVSAAHTPTNAPEDIFSGKHTAIGRITRTIERPQSTAYVVEIRQLDTTQVTPFMARLSINSVENTIWEGSLIKFRAVFHNLNIPQDVPNEIDYNKYLKSEGIVCTGSIISGISELSKPDLYHKTVHRTRERIYNAIVESPCTPATATFLIATLLGDKSLLTEDDFIQFRSTGVAHILALSGLHLGIIAAIISVLLFPLNLHFRHRRLRGAIVVALIWIYAVLVGLQPSILRAAVMITVLILSGYIQRGYFVFNSLFISIIVILLINPDWLFSPGFQLSVAAVASILMFGNLVPIRFKKYPLVYYLLNLILIPIAAMAGTGIVSAYYFGTFPSMFIFGNIIAGLLFPWILAGGIILALCTGIDLRFAVLGRVVDELHNLLISSLTYFREFEGEITNMYFSAWTIFPYVIALIFLAFALRERKQYQWLMCASMLCLTVILYSCDTERIPRAELYIPRLTQATRIIMRSGTEAKLYTNADLHDMEISECNTRYRRFLLSRGCPDHFEKAGEGWRNNDFIFVKDYIQACGKLIRIINTDQNLAKHNLHSHYALVTNAYKGRIPELKSKVNCDTFLLGPDLHPSRRARMIRECGDSIPFRDVRTQGFSIVQY